MTEVIKIKSKTLPIMLYFLASNLPTEDEAADIMSIEGFTICQRNVAYDDGMAMEPCTAVAGCYPERYAEWDRDAEVKPAPIKEPKVRPAKPVAGWSAPAKPVA